MTDNVIENLSDQEEHVAHILWAAHILSYLTGTRSHAELHPDEPDHDQEIDEEDFDVLTGKAATLTSTESHESARSKFLDCIAELLSPSKGWHHVTATALGEYEDRVEIGIARNGGIGATGSMQYRQVEQYFRLLEKYLASCVQRGSSSRVPLPLSDFELATIKFNCLRIDQSFETMRSRLSTARASQHLIGDGPNPPRALASWNSFVTALESGDLGDNRHRESTVSQAYHCTTSPEVLELLLRTFGKEKGLQLWRALRIIARPILNCRLLQRIVNHFPQFGNVALFQVFPGPKTAVPRKYQRDITEAWAALLPGVPMRGRHGAISDFGRRFREDLARAFSTHAEVQLFIHYETRATLKPTFDYFGCSKKTCLLCEAFLHSLPRPISSRGRHGICHPAWRVPISSSAATATALSKLEKILVSRIKTYLDSPPNQGFEDPVPQSTIVSDFTNMTLELTRRKKLVIAVEEDQRRLREERQLLDGAVSSSEQAESPIIDRSDYCIMCNKSPAKICTRCRSCHYCSSKCQKSDWPSHKLLCKAFASQSPRPSSSHKRAIFFPVAKAKPRPVWIPCPRKIDDETGVPYDSPDIRSLLGNDNPFPGTTHIEVNARRGRRLGSGFAVWAPRKEGYSITLEHREAFLRDGSAINRSMLEAVKTSGTMGHQWRGPLIAMRELSTQFFEDITLADFRHIIDYIVDYASTDVKESPSPQNREGRPPGTILGVKICCYGEMKLHGADPYISVEVPSTHPIHYLRREEDISPISRRLGIPLQLWKYPESDFEGWLAPPGWPDTMGAESNQNAAFLMKGCDPKRDGLGGWGWAPFSWNHDIGNVLAIRADGRDLRLEDVKLIGYFIRKKLQPMFEDSMGAGLVSRSKQEVLDFITWDNVEKCREELDETSDTS